MTFLEPEQRDKALFPWDPFKGVVVPRPNWIAEPISKAGDYITPGAEEDLLIPSRVARRNGTPVTPSNRRA